MFLRSSSRAYGRMSEVGLGFEVKVFAVMRAVKGSGLHEPDSKDPGRTASALFQTGVTPNLHVQGLSN